MTSLSNASDAAPASGEFQALFEPRGIAVVGASNVPAKWGFRLGYGLAKGGYRGPIAMVNPKERKVLGRRTFDSLKSVPFPVDVAFIAIPRGGVAGVLDACGEKKIPFAVVISSGFREAGAEGAEEEAKIVRVAQSAGVRIVGPNTMGIVSLPAGVVAMGVTRVPERGPVAFLSQSGNLGTMLMEWGGRQGLGFSRFVNVGNEAMIGAEEILPWLAGDPETKVVLLYLEGTRSGRKLVEAIRSCARTKPVLVLKGGTTAAGERAARAHSGALAGSARVWEAAVAQAGGVLVGSTEELLETARAAVAAPLPKGRRVGMVTWGGGWGVLSADACHREGLLLPELPEGIKSAIDHDLPSFWSHGNPVDLVGVLSRKTHFRILETMARSDAFDAVLSLGNLMGNMGKKRPKDDTWGHELRLFLRAFGWKSPGVLLAMLRGLLKPAGGKKKSAAPPAATPAPGSGGGGEREQIGGFDWGERELWQDDHFSTWAQGLMRETGRPLVAVPFHVPSTLGTSDGSGLATAPTPERGARLLALLATLGERQRAIGSPSEAPPQPGAPALANAREMTSTAPSGTVLSERESRLLLEPFGIPFVKTTAAGSEEGAVTAAERTGWPVVAKVDKPGLIHKSDVGGVRVGLKSADDVRKAFRELMRVGEGRPRGVLIQETAPPGVEVLVGLTSDPQFGTVVVVGMGGVQAEAMEDVAVGLAPFGAAEAMRMLDRLRARKLLDGFRGAPKSDVAALAEMIARVSAIGAALEGRIAELDLNPVRVLPEGKGVICLDAATILPRRPINS